MNIELAKKRIAELQYFVDLTESYQPRTLNEIIIKEYAITGSIEKTTNKLNELGYKIDDRNYETRDVSAVINSNPRKSDDELHRIVRKFYRKKIKNSSFL
ncbi:hypothetical protein KDN24_06145 [Bacillus sp. Bva_UNVM-123]|uniref:hypothetical protein n=1 Tax=Bacillus sp. Bva_UNVM-123 TaxID=2829798 RepID=UPI00391F3CFA